MAIPTTRTNQNAEILIHEEICSGCGLCVSVCKNFSLEIKNNKAVMSSSSVFGCIGCGHCMAICPTGAIEINGRTLSPKDLFPIPSKEECTDYESLLNLFKRRRSIREFKEKEVEQEIIDKIMEAARYSPMGLPPTDVHLMVLDSKEKSNAFAKDFVEHLDKMKWLTSNWFLTLMRPFWGKSNDQLFREFIKPAINFFKEEMKQNHNYLTYDAPLTIYFYGSHFSDPADPIIAATYAMMAAESLGLGSCMLGTIHPLIQNGKNAEQLRQKYGIKYTSREGLVVVFGYPAVKYLKGIQRTFASD